MSDTSSGEPLVGLIGLGRMGQAIASRLAGVGLLAAVYNRTTAVCRDQAQRFDVEACGTPAELASKTTIVITTLADGDALRAVYEARDGVLTGIRPNLLCIEMGTTGPVQIKQLGRRICEHGGRLVDAPVSGSVELALQGQLTILAGGDPASISHARPVFEALGPRTFHLGALGAGATMKLAVNNVVYGLNQSIAESLVLAERAGIEPSLAYEVFANSSISAPFVHYRRALFEHPGREPVQMSTKLAMKDLDLIEQLAKVVGARVPQQTVNREVLASAIEAGRAEEDVTAVAAHLRECM